MCSSDVFLSLLAILFPPLPVWVKRGICSADSLINILLLILGYIPGLIHAWYIIFKHPEPPYDYDYTQGSHNAEHGRGHQQGRVYVFVHDGSGNSRPAPLHQQSHYAAQPKLLQNSMNYGSTGNAGNSSSPHHGGHEEGVAGPSTGGDAHAPPPSYAQVVASGTAAQQEPGDHKVQTQD
ncbi:hypothetical protein QBC42DRAFT_174157 [Cladorrhinum samala]|uniref:Stress response RCI peptide n=1 Tax=Cladorrhinum samala TaxID=585594 RepID=A0AAV9HTT1_9PEZI|nr:hypothetical protein QBC42DRAFT_174157 [Cladorrhinum samala]